MSLLPGPAGGHAGDVVLAVLLAVVVASGSIQRSSQLDPVLYRLTAGPLEPGDTWFDADIPDRTCMALRANGEEHSATEVHPLSAMLTYGPVAGVRRMTTLSALDAIRVVLAAASAAWIVTVFGLLRLMGCRRIDAAIFGLVAAVSATTVFWTAVPELFLAGSVTLLLPLCLVAGEARGRRFSDSLFGLASAASLSLTITNWMSGLLAPLLTRSWSRAAQISVNALAGVTVLWWIQSRWFPHTVFFLDGARVSGIVGDLRSAVAMPWWTMIGGRARAALGFVLNGMVMPQVGFNSGEHDRQVTIADAPGAFGWLGLLAAAVWVLLLIGGSRQMQVDRPARPLAVLLAVSVLWHLMVYLVIGQEMFLYAMHFFPLLLAVAAWGSLGPWRHGVLAAALVLIVLAGVNNVQQFDRAADFVRTMGVEAGPVAEALCP